MALTNTQEWRFRMRYEQLGISFSNAPLKNEWIHIAFGFSARHYTFFYNGMSKARIQKSRAYAPMVGLLMVKQQKQFFYCKKNSYFNKILFQKVCWQQSKEFRR